MPALGQHVLLLRTKCLLNLISMCWHGVGMPQLGHLLVRPGVFNILDMLPDMFRPCFFCGSIRTSLCGKNQFHLQYNALSIWRFMSSWVSNTFRTSRTPTLQSAYQHRRRGHPMLVRQIVHKFK